MITNKGKISPQVIDTIAQHISKGNYIHVACTASGISQQTYENWIHRAEALLNNPNSDITEVDYLYLQFWDAVKRSEATAETKAVQCVRDAMPKNWLAAMTWLERKFPEKWGRREALDVNFTKGIALLERLSGTLKSPAQETKLLAVGSDNVQFNNQSSEAKAE